jgi:hypothetical protein
VTAPRAPEPAPAADAFRALLRKEAAEQRQTALLALSTLLGLFVLALAVSLARRAFEGALA